MFLQNNCIYISNIYFLTTKRWSLKLRPKGVYYE